MSFFFRTFAKEKNAYPPLSEYIRLNGFVSLDAWWLFRGISVFRFMEEKEIWKPIKRLVRFNSKYEIVKEFYYDDGSCVSNLGRVLLSNGKISKTKPNTKGYVTVKLGNERFKVQQVMMQTFHPEGISNGYSVDHIDRNPYNNHLDNLRWATTSLQTSNRENKMYKYKKVICVENGVVYSSCQEAENSLGLVRNTVSRVARGERKSIHGYHFYYVGCELDKEYFDKGCERFNRECKGEIVTKDGNIVKQMSIFDL